MLVLHLGAGLEASGIALSDVQLRTAFSARRNWRMGEVKVFSLEVSVPGVSAPGPGSGATTLGAASGAQQAASLAVQGRSRYLLDPGKVPVAWLAASLNPKTCGRALELSLS